jgi:iron complex outermembrane receptor protein
VASAKHRPLALSNNLDLSWQTGVFLFDQDYQQTAANSLSSVFGLFPPSVSQSTADLDDWGASVYGQTKLTCWEKLDFSTGLRFDYEDKRANLGSSVPPASSLSDDFSQVSPQFALAYRFATNQTAYASIARGYKAGGFNPPPTGVAAPAGTQEYGAEHTWNYEVGCKSRWLDGKLETTAALFYIDWQNLQLNEQVPSSGGQYFIGNAGAAASKGVELEVKCLPLSGWDIFGQAGYTDARFLSGSTAFNPNLSAPNGANQDVGGSRLPYTPTFTCNVGTEVFCTPGRAVTLYARGEVTVCGDFEYDASNAQGQSTYSLASFRAGVRSNHWFAEGWVNNAFDTHYVPIAIPYGQLAPSGYVGESGAPVTFGLRAGIMF